MDVLLAKATNNWDMSNNIGNGGYGEVFKGEWLHQEVAIKRIRYFLKGLSLSEFFIAFSQVATTHMLIFPNDNLSHFKFGDGDGPNLYWLNEIDVSSTFYWKFVSVWVDPRQF